MTTYPFTLTLASAVEMTSEMAEALFEESHHDCVPGDGGGGATVYSNREAGDLGEAVGLASRQIQKAGYKVARVEIQEPRTSLTDRPPHDAMRLGAVVSSSLIRTAPLPEPRSLDARQHRRHRHRSTC